jgi:hypothetical protein
MKTQREHDSTFAAVPIVVGAICFVLTACGSEPATAPDGESQQATQHAAADDVVAQVELRKVALAEETGRPLQTGAAAAERWIQHHRLILGKH